VNGIKRFVEMAQVSAIRIFVDVAGQWMTQIGRNHPRYGREKIDFQGYTHKDFSDPDKNPNAPLDILDVELSSVDSANKYGPVIRGAISLRGHVLR
jgi:hypothetical protein